MNVSKLQIVGWLLPIFSFAITVFAADSEWARKPPPEWSAKDVQQLLDNSPWAKTVAATRLPELTATQRQQGGVVGGGKAVGLKGLNGITRNSLGGLTAQLPNVDVSSTREFVNLRWETALPVRVAELKTAENNTPDWQSAEYAIGVYQVLGLHTDQKSISGELKKSATLKRDGKKDIKPIRVEIIQETSDRAKVFYFFSRSDEITAADTRVTFVAQIGRIVVASYFYPAEMQFQGKLEL